MSRMLDVLRKHNGVSLSTPEEARRPAVAEENVLASLGYASRPSAEAGGGPWRVVLAAVLVVVTGAVLWQVAAMGGLVPGWLGSGPTNSNTLQSAAFQPDRPPATESPAAVPAKTNAPSATPPATASGPGAGGAVSDEREAPPEISLPVLPKRSAPRQNRVDAAPPTASAGSGTGNPRAVVVPPLTATERTAPAVTRNVPGASAVLPKGASVVPPIYRTPSGEVDSFKLALYYHRNGDFENALVQYRAVLERNELNAEAHNNLGLLYQDKKLYDEAIREFRRATFIDPQYLKARNNLGVALLRSGKSDASVAEFQALVAQDPHGVEGLTNLALALKATGKSEEARELLVRALGENGKYGAAHYNLALIYEEAGELGRALEHYDRFLSLAGAENAALAVDVRARMQALRGKLIPKD